jgi:hypothetical protein
MRPKLTRTILATVVAGVAATGLAAAPAGADPAARAPTFSDPTRIDNPYLPLSKFHRCTLRGQEDGKKQLIHRTVLDRTRTFDIGGVPVEAMVVKDRVHADGKLIENTHDFFAQDDRGTVHYLGERVENIRNGHVRNHSGSWLVGRDTAKPGVLIPAKPRKGDRWMSEDAPPITVEHDKMIKRIPRYDVHGHTYRHAIEVREYALPDKEIEHKVYAKGVGVIDELPPEGDVGLVGCSG